MPQKSRKGAGEPEKKSRENQKKGLPVFHFLANSVPPVLGAFFGQKVGAFFGPKLGLIRISLKKLRRWPPKWGQVWPHFGVHGIPFFLVLGFHFLKLPFQVQAVWKWHNHFFHFC